MFVDIYSCMWNAFCFDSIRFEGIFNLNALSMRWTRRLACPTLAAESGASNIGRYHGWRPTLAATMASVQRPDIHFCTFLFTEMFYTSSVGLPVPHTVNFYFISITFHL